MTVSGNYDYFTEIEVKELVAHFIQKYPNKNIVVNKNKWGSAIEIICEIEPTSEHSEYSRAIVVAKHIALHYHKESIEEYKILEGELILYKNGKIFELKTGDQITINPYEIHWGDAGSGITQDKLRDRHNNRSNFVVVEIYPKPGWKFDDHFVI